MAKTLTSCCFGHTDEHTKIIEKQLKKEKKQLRRQVSNKSFSIYKHIFMILKCNIKK